MNGILSHAPAGIPLSERAMLASVNIRQWSGRRLDKRVTDETNRAHGAESDAGRYNKLLIAKPHIAELQKIAGKARNDFYWHTLPWLDNGGRILPAAGYDGFMRDMNQARLLFESKTREFISGYPAFIEESRIRLNGMFNADDYPAPADIAGRFSFDVAILPFPESADFRVALPDSDAIRQQIESRTQELVGAAMRESWSRIAEVVGAMAEKLAAYKPAAGEQKAENVFRDSLVANLESLVEILPGINIAADPNMSKIADLMQSHLCGLSAEKLRSDHALRGETARKAEAIGKAISAFM